MSEDSKSFSEAVDGFPEMCSYHKVQGFKDHLYKQECQFGCISVYEKEALKLDVLAISLFVTPTYLIEMCYSSLECIYLERKRTTAPAPEQQDDAPSQRWRSSAFAVCAHVCAVHLREHSPVAIMLLRLPMDPVLFSSFCYEFVN